MVRELSGRLTRLEGLVLGMSSQLMPVLVEVLSKNLPLEAMPAPPLPETPLAMEQPQEDEPDDLPAPRKRWWSRRVKE
jgi:hypothetical protein